MITTVTSASDALLLSPVSLFIFPEIPAQTHARRSDFRDGNNSFLVCSRGRRRLEVRRCTSARLHVYFYPRDRRRATAPSHSGVFPENPESRWLQWEPPQLRCKPRGQLVSLRRANTSKRGGRAAVSHRSLVALGAE